MKNCNKGQVAGTVVLNPDCPCENGIASITQSADKTKLYVTYTDGGTQTFILPSGVPGPQGNPGAQGAAGANGTSCLWNDFTAGSSTGTGSLQILNPNTQILPANTLKNVGDSVLLRYVFSTTTPGQGQTTGLTLNGKDIIGSLITIAPPSVNPIGLFSANNWNQLQYLVRVTMTGAATAQVDAMQESFAVSAGGIVVSTGTKFQVTFGQTGLNFAIAQPIQALGQNPSGKTAVNYLQGSADLILTI